MKRKIGIVIGGILLVALGFTIASIIIRPGKVVFYEDKNSGMTTFRPAAVTAGDDIPSLQAFNDAFVQIAESVTPSVVTITTEKVIKTNLRRDFPGFPDDDLFWRFFGFPQGEMRSKALGSGVIVDQKGYILTNNHVVERGEKISVKLIDNREFKAEIVGTDPLTDLAVIKIDAKDLQPAILGDSDALRVGEWVLAIGSPFSENLAHTVTAGIVSAKGRSGVINNTNYESFIQTDAAINPGNSGGALVNIRAELIGINTAIATAGMSQGNVGIGFAIPINLAKKVMTDLIEKGKVVRAWLGVVIGDVDENIAKSLGIESRQGAIISEVVKDSPAEKAGLKVGDVIKEFDGKTIKDSAHLRTLVSTSEVGKPKTLVVLRGKKELKIDVKLGELPESVERGVYPDTKSDSKLGIRVDEINSVTASQYGISPDETGVVVTGVDRNGRAAGILQVGDIIKRIGERDISNVAEYQKALEEVKTDIVLILIKRKNVTFFETIDLSK
ncbi:MAG TPA: DegQ family serine endoprotease [Candidatus Marinimicrobia bacterium]|nr:DegQ family serine endoprotease [Candidatus Neomarinimicrobiota bacterium]